MNVRITQGLIGSAAAALLLVGGFASAQTGSWGKGDGHPPVGGQSGIVGTVSAISGDTLTISSNGFGKGGSGTFTVNASNAAVTKGGATSTVSSIAVGDTVTVQGSVAGSVTATKINDGTGKSVSGPVVRGGPVMNRGIVGTVSAVSGNTITVSSKGFGKSATTTAYTVDATNAKVTKGGSASTVPAIAVGDTIIVQGTVSGTSVTATMIFDGVLKGGQGKPAQGPSIQGNGEPVVGGSVTGINGSTLTITNKAGVTYTISVASSTVDKGNATSSVSNISLGDNVIVQGAVNGNSVTASSVIDQGTTTRSSSNTSGHGFMGGFLGSLGGIFHKLFGFF